MSPDRLADITEDGLLDRRIALQQPRRGYRAGDDAILLAAALPAKPGQTVLDVGAGVGAVSLCLAWRCPELNIRGLELQAELVTLAQNNIAANNMAARVGILRGDIRQPPPEIGQATFDHTICNPPFHVAGRASTPPDASKAIAHGEGETPLEDWLAFCLRRTVSGGTVTVIHRSERLGALLSGLRQGAGDMVIFPLWARRDRPAKRVIVQARVGGLGPDILHPGLCLLDGNGEDSEQARAVLREGAALDLSS
jgi:tRNA1(Val) A37 N6-methylase TrmN6